MNEITGKDIKKLWVERNAVCVELKDCWIERVLICDYKQLGGGAACKQQENSRVDCDVFFFWLFLELNASVFAR